MIFGEKKKGRGALRLMGGQPAEGQRCTEPVSPGGKQWQTHNPPHRDVFPGRARKRLRADTRMHAYWIGLRRGFFSNWDGVWISMVHRIAGTSTMKMIDSTTMPIQIAGDTNVYVSKIFSPSYAAVELSITTERSSRPRKRWACPGGEPRPAPPTRGGNERGCRRKRIEGERCDWRQEGVPGQGPPTARSCTRRRRGRHLAQTARPRW